jgi:GTP-binding protein Era
MMKQTGEDARKEIERLLGRRVFLTLWVTVERGWRQNPHVLRELGYT